MYRRGFTIIELIIVITIMGILLVVGVANLRSSQATARDDQRASDVQAIAANLEQYYNTGNATLSLSPGTYLSTTSWNGSNTSLLSVLPDMDPKSIVAPGQTSSYSSFVPATCSGACSQTTAGVSPQPTINTFVYQPLQQSGNLCTNVSQGCQKFNIFYMLENATIACPATSNNICMVTSKNQ